MNVYIFQAALLCEACGVHARGKQALAGKCPEQPEAESTYDSNDYPKGPYPDGGGEADTPQHCDNCGAFLENALTPDGLAYVVEWLILYPEKCTEWKEFYRDEIAGYDFRKADAVGSTYASDTRCGELSDDLGETPDYDY